MQAEKDLDFNWRTVIVFGTMLAISALITAIYALNIPHVFIAFVLSVSLLFLSSYVHIRYLLPLYKKRKWKLYAGLFFLLTLPVSTLDSYIHTCLKFPGHKFEFTACYFISDIFATAFIISIITAVYEQYQKIKRTEQQQIELRSEKLSTELNFLKAQINPHFLFNTLNNIYFYACSQHEQTPEMIEKLSSILRYIVYDCKKDRTALEKEMDNMEHLMKLYRIKNSAQKAITFQRPPVSTNLLIAPMILLNLLENAFKHGDALNNKDGFIHVKAEIDESDHLYFQISNTVKQKKKHSKEEGIGQLNIKKQLDLIYGDRYTLVSQLKDGIFNLNLIVQLDRKEA